MPRRLVDPSGFVLLETIVATALLVAGVLALAQLIVVAARATTAASQTTGAAMHAAQKVEELRAAPWPPAGSGADRVGDYARTWVVVPLDGDPPALARVVVEVTPGTVRVVTLRSRKVP
jgi:Tfp pilus assembly protein PilV